MNLVGAFQVVTLLLVASISQALPLDLPKVRTITAFIRIDRDQYKKQFAETVTMLNAAKEKFESDGWTVQTVRIVTQPFPEYLQGLSRDKSLEFLREIDGIARKDGFVLGIGPAMRSDSDDPASMVLLGEFLAGAKSTNATALTASTRGIHWKVIAASAKLVKFLEENSPNSEAAFSFTAVAMMPEYSPFYPAAYHTGPGRRFAIGLESASVVARVFAASNGDVDNASANLKAQLSEVAQKVEKVALAVSKRSGWTYMGLDPTPAPLADVSIGAAFESLLGANLGSSGTLTVARLITEAVKSVPVKQTGYSGLMLPVLEDRRISQRWSEGKLSLDGLLAYSAVCSTGLDIVPVPGNISERQLARIIGDVASLAYKWNKPLNAHLLPVKGKNAGERTDFHNPLLVNAILQPLP